MMMSRPTVDCSTTCRPPDTHHIDALEPPLIYPARCLKKSDDGQYASSASFALSRSYIAIMRSSFSTSARGSSATLSINAKTVEGLPDGGTGRGRSGRRPLGITFRFIVGGNAVRGTSQCFGKCLLIHRSVCVPRLVPYV